MEGRPVRRIKTNSLGAVAALDDLHVRKGVGWVAAVRDREGNLHVGQELRQVRCPTVFDISIEQHSTLENTTQRGKEEGHRVAG